MLSLSLKLISRVLLKLVCNISTRWSCQYTNFTLGGCIGKYCGLKSSSVKVVPRVNPHPYLWGDAIICTVVLVPVGVLSPMPSKYQFDHHWNILCRCCRVYVRIQIDRPVPQDSICPEASLLLVMDVFTLHLLMKLSHLLCCLQFGRAGRFTPII